LWWWRRRRRRRRRLWREVEIKNRKQGKHKKNGDIKEKTKHKRQR
jgi:hypothetical protein